VHELWLCWPHNQLLITVCLHQSFLQILLSKSRWLGWWVLRSSLGQC
jgi:hypothetical protein